MKVELDGQNNKNLLISNLTYNYNINGLKGQQKGYHQKQRYDRRYIII